MVYLIVSPSTIFAFVRGVWMTRLHSTLHVQQLSYIPGSQSGKSKDSEVVGAVQKKQLQHGVRKKVLRPLRRRAHAQVNCSCPSTTHDVSRYFPAKRLNAVNLSTSTYLLRIDLSLVSLLNKVNRPQSRHMCLTSLYLGLICNTQQHQQSSRVPHFCSIFMKEL